MKNAQLKSTLIFTIIALLGIFSAYAFSITLNHPSSEWIKSNSIPFNFTVTERGYFLKYCAVYANNSGSMALKANYTFMQNGTHVAGIVLNDSSGKGLVYGWNVTCYNGTNEAWATVARFGVDGHSPIATLSSPLPNVYQSSTTATFVYSGGDSSNFEGCYIYHNMTGTWHLNHTNTSLTMGGLPETISFASQSNGKYIWNVYCNDSANNNLWAANFNRTFSIDSTQPGAVVFGEPSNNTYSSNRTPFVTWNKSNEVNFKDYSVRVSLYKNASDPFQTKTITNISENFTTLNYLPDLKTYYIRVSVHDLANNERNSTVLYYTVNTTSTAPTITLNYPPTLSYLPDSTPDFNVTVSSVLTPDSCVLYLSNPIQGIDISPNMTIKVTNGTNYNLTPLTMADAAYAFNIECNDSDNKRVNVSSTTLNVTIDTTKSNSPDILSLWHGKNNTDRTPWLIWAPSYDINFQKYVVDAYYASNSSVAYETIVSTNTTTSTPVNLPAGDTYNFTVTTYDKAGNTNTSNNNSVRTSYYVDPVCGVLNPGWNLCGATWTTSKQLSLIGNETGASFVTVWNSTHQWATCNYGVSSTGANCQLDVGISNGTSHAVWLYVSTATNWQNRTWEATAVSSDIRLNNATNRWNLEAGFIRNGRVFGHIKNKFRTNVSMFSMPYNNGTSASYVNSGLFAALNNATTLDYGRGIWFYYNGTEGGTEDLIHTNYTLGGW